MADEDVNGTTADSSDAADVDTYTDDDSHEHSEAASDKADGEESKSIPYSRFKQVNDAKKEAERVARWYQDNVGDPTDVVEFRKWKSSQVAKAEEAEEAGKITPTKLAEIKKVMRQADPEYAALVERQKQADEARTEAQFDEAEEIVRELAGTEYGLKSKSDESDISWLAKQTMLAIKDDAKLQRLWAAGSTERCIKRAFNIVKERNSKLGGSISKLKQEATDKRRISKLPTLPSASGSLTGKSGEKRDKGLTKQTDSDAWAVFQNSISE